MRLCRAIGGAALIVCATLFVGTTGAAAADADAPQADDLSLSTPDRVVPMARAADTCHDEYRSDWSIAFPGSSVCWVPNGDVLWVCDNYGDNMHPAGNVYYKGKYSFWHVTGIAAGECGVFDMDLQEGRDIDWQAEVWEKRTMKYQGGWIDGYT